jgi:hypothetical protein
MIGRMTGAFGADDVGGGVWSSENCVFRRSLAATMAYNLNQIDKTDIATAAPSGYLQGGPVGGKERCCRTYTIPRLSRVDVEDGVWFYLQRSPGTRPDRDLPTCLTWFLEQLLFEQFGRYADTDDDIVVGLNIGIDQPTKIADGAPAAEQALQAKHIAMQLAGLVANARIEGVAPDHQAVPDMILAAFEADAEAYTQYYFAFELRRHS